MGMEIKSLSLGHSISIRHSFGFSFYIINGMWPRTSHYFMASKAEEECYRIWTEPNTRQQQKPEKDTRTASSAATVECLNMKSVLPSSSCCCRRCCAIVAVVVGGVLMEAVTGAEHKSAIDTNSPWSPSSDQQHRHHHRIWRKDCFLFFSFFSFLFFFLVQECAVFITADTCDD